MCLGLATQAQGLIPEKPLVLSHDPLTACSSLANSGVFGKLFSCPCQYVDLLCALCRSCAVSHIVESSWEQQPCPVQKIPSYSGHTAQALRICWLQALDVGVGLQMSCLGLNTCSLPFDQLWISVITSFCYKKERLCCMRAAFISGHKNE